MQIIKEIILKSMNNKTIRYGILESKENNDIKYGIGIYETYKGNTMNETFNDISDKKEVVINLINYLSENAVDTAHFKDIIEDYIIYPNN